MGRLENSGPKTFVFLMKPCYIGKQILQIIRQNIACAWSATSLCSIRILKARPVYFLWQVAVRRPATLAEIQPQFYAKWGIESRQYLHT